MVSQDSFYQRVATLIAAAVLLCLLYLLLPVLVPFIVALILAYLFNPIAKWLGKYGIRRVFAIVLVFTIVSMVLITAVALLIPALIEQFELGKNNMPKFFAWLNNDARPWISRHLNIDIDEFDFNAVSASIMEYLQKNYNFQDAGSVISKIATSGASAIGTIGLFVLVPVVAFFYMLSWESMVKTVKDAIPLRFRAKTLSLMDECDSVMMSFVKGQMLVMFLLGTFYAIGLELVGLDTGLFIGFMAGLASIVPYLGLVVGVVAAVIATIVQFGFDWYHLALVGGVFAFGQLIEAYGLQPFLLGDRIGLSPVMVILAVLVGGQLMGLVGMLIGLPLAAVLMVLFRHAMAAYKRSDLYRKRADGTVIDDAALESEIAATHAQPIPTTSPVAAAEFAWVAVADEIQRHNSAQNNSQQRTYNNAADANTTKHTSKRNSSRSRNQQRNRNNQNNNTHQNQNKQRGKGQQSKQQRPQQENNASHTAASNTQTARTGQQKTQQTSAETVQGHKNNQRTHSRRRRHTHRKQSTSHQNNSSDD